MAGISRMAQHPAKTIYMPSFATWTDHLRQVIFHMHDQGNWCGLIEEAFHGKACMETLNTIDGCLWWGRYWAEGGCRGPKAMLALTVPRTDPCTPRGHGLYTRDTSREGPRPCPNENPHQRQVNACMVTQPVWQWGRGKAVWGTGQGSSPYFTGPLCPCWDERGT